MNKEITLEDEIRIEASPSDVWGVLSDLSLVHEFSPGVKNAFYTTEQKTGVGAGRHCDLVPFGSVEEVVIDWTEEKSLTIQITEGKGLPPVRDITGRFTLTPDGSGTVVHTQFRYLPTLGPIGLLMNKLIVKPQFKSAFRGLLGGLKNYVEDGAFKATAMKLNEPKSVSAAA